MSMKSKLAMILVVIGVFGCKGPLQSSAASAAEGANGRIERRRCEQWRGIRTENVTDPTMNNIPAFYVKVPASWKFQGALLQGGPATCDSYAMLTWKTTSPDGLSKMEQMPQMLWSMGMVRSPRTDVCRSTMR